MLFSVAGCVNWPLPSRPAVSQAESGFSFFSHFRSSSFRWKNSFIIIFISSCESKHGGVSCSCVGSVELGQLGIFANSFVYSLGWLLQGEFVVFPWSFRWIPMSFSLLSFQMSLAGSTISPNDFRGALTGPMSFPSAVQVSVDVHAVHPSVRTLFRSGTSMGVSFFVGRGCVPLPGWRLGIVLALGAL